MTVAELLDRMSSRELAEWMAYERIEPSGQERIELMIAQLTALFFNVHRAEGASAKSAEDFLLRQHEEPEPQGMDDQIVRAQMMAAMLGKRP
jgi:hypothetical protein